MVKYEVLNKECKWGSIRYRMSQYSGGGAGSGEEGNYGEVRGFETRECKWAAAFDTE